MKSDQAVPERGDDDKAMSRPISDYGYEVYVGEQPILDARLHIGDPDPDDLRSGDIVLRVR